MNVRSLPAATNRAVVVVSLMCVIWLAGCGGSSDKSAVQSTPIPSAIDIHGQWQIVMQSAATNGILILNANLSQKGADVLADKSSVVLVQGTQAAGGITYTALGGRCDASSLGNDEIL